MLQDIIGVKVQKTIRNSRWVSFITLLSRVLGYIRDAVMVMLFPPEVCDAWTVAYRIPNFVRRLAGEGVFSAFLISSEHKEKRMAQESATYIICLFMLLSVLGWLCAGPLLRFLLPETYQAQSQSMGLTIQMAQVMSFFIGAITVYGILSSFLHLHRSFIAPAVAMVLFNVTMLLSTLGPKLGGYTHPMILAWGVLAGGIVMAVFVGLALARENLFPHWHFGSIKKMAQLFFELLPSVIVIGFLQLFHLINTQLAGRFGEGMITSLYIADRFLEFPLALFVISVGLTYLPDLEKLWSEKEKASFENLFSQAVKRSFFWVIPSAFGIYIVAPLIVQVLFKRGEFHGPMEEATVLALQWNAIIMLGFTLVRLGILYFLSLKQKLKVSIFLLVILFIYYLLGIFWFDSFEKMLIGTSITMLTTGLSLMALSYGQLSFNFYKTTLFNLARNFIAGFAMFVVLTFLKRALTTQVVLTVQLIILCGVGVLVYLAVDYLLSRSPIFPRVGGE